MNWQVYVLPPPTLPHGRLSQSLSLLAEPDAERPIQVVAAGMVSVVVVSFGRLYLIVDVDVVIEDAVTSDESVFRLHVSLAQYLLSPHASYMVLFSFPRQYEPSIDWTQAYFTSMAITLLLLHSL
jgi:hypothetical protein